MMLFYRAEKEADWPLHLHAVRLMMLYFFAAGHPNYAHFGLYYLHTITDKPKDILARFMKGEHVTRHSQGSWNGMWSDMMIETTFMKYAKGQNWTISLHACCVLSKELEDMV